MRPLRVLLLIDSMRMGGAERITVALLPHFDRERVTPIICTLHKRRESPLANQLGDVLRLDLGARRLLDPGAIRRLLQIIRTQQIDLIHAQLQDATIFGAIAHQRLGVPMIVTRHLMVDDTSTRRRLLRAVLERFVIRHTAARIITVSDAAQAAYSQAIKCPASRFQTIYNGIDLERFSPADDKTILRRNLNLPIAGPLVTMVGVIRPGKGHEVAINAARLLPDIHLLLVGDGMDKYRAELEAQARDLPDRVHLLGQRLDIPDILRASDLLILPSENEALPTVLIEAGATALPVIATQVGGVPEVVRDGETGILIPPRDPQALADAIRRLVDDPTLASALGRCAYDHVRGLFTLDHQAEATTTLYETVVARSGYRG